MAEADALPIIQVAPYFVAPVNEHVKKSGGFTNTRHSRESGNPEAVVRNIGSVFVTETPQTDSRFRGNDEE